MAIPPKNAILGFDIYPIMGYTERMETNTKTVGQKIFSIVTAAFFSIAIIQWFMAGDAVYLAVALYAFVKGNKSDGD